MSCGCDSNLGCECSLSAGAGIQVQGLGTAGDPYIISNTQPQVAIADTPSLDLTKIGNTVSGTVRLAPLLTTTDTGTVEMTLAGAGTEASPFSLSAVITNLILTGGTTGQVITKKPDGSWGPGAMTTAPVGSVATENGLFGDGSGASPVRIIARTYAQWESVVDNAIF